MKYLLFTFFAFALMFTSCSSGDDTTEPVEDLGKVYEGSITLKSPSEIIEFGSENYNTITGSLIIQDLPNQEYIINLNGLNSIKTIKGNLSFINNTRLENIEGLSNLSSVYSIDIINNESLESIEGLNGVTELLGDFIIENNYSLINLNGLQNLETVNYLRIEKCASLENIIHLESLTRLSDGIIFIYNHNIESLTGLNNLEFIGWAVFRNNDSLKDFCALQNLQNIPSYFSVHNNAFNPTIQNIFDGFCSL